MIKKLLALLLTLTAAATCGAPAQEGFYSVRGQDIVDSQGEKAVFKGICFGNSVWTNDINEVYRHHSEDSYRELSELGFNSVRFFLNYRWFESDDAPYAYIDEGFEMLAQNIAWAEKYGIGLILNMHYPQGGYQSQGNGTALWTDEENKKRLTALWGEIAKRCADETAVIGYGLINEPVVPKLSTMEKTVAQCDELMQRITDEIRRYDSRHLLFIEGVCGVRDMATGKTEWEVPVELRALVDDPLAVYESHFYEPFFFTHQSAGDNVVYPDPTLRAEDYISWYVRSEGLESRDADGGWRYFESAALSADEAANVLTPAPGAWNLGDGAAYYDDLKLTEMAADGSARVVWSEDFSEEKKPASTWSADGSGTAEYDAAHGRTALGCLKISGNFGGFSAAFANVPMLEGCTYTLSGYVLKEAQDGSAYINADLALARSFYTVNRDYIFERLDSCAEFARSHNVPLYLGEFGADNASAGAPGGERWAADVLDWLDENGVSFSYHAYHEPMFGLYPNGDDYEYLTGRRELLADVFRRKLSAG